MKLQIQLTFEELQQAVLNYAKANGAALPADAKVGFQCYGPDVQTPGGIISISAAIVVQEQQPVAQPAAAPTA